MGESQVIIDGLHRVSGGTFHVIHSIHMQGDQWGQGPVLWEKTGKDLSGAVRLSAVLWITGGGFEIKIICEK